MKRIELLEKRHRKNDFDCGNLAINDFLKQQANQNQNKQYSKTYVLCDEKDPNAVLGFYTLAFCILDLSLIKNISINYPYELVGIKLARMGITESSQGKKYSQRLIFDAIEKTCLVGSVAGMQGLFVDPKNEQLTSFYRKYGFASIPDSNSMWIPIKSCIELVES